MAAVNLTIRDIEQAILKRLEPIADRLALRIVNKPRDLPGRIKPKGEVVLFYTSSNYGSLQGTGFNSPRRQDRTFAFQLQFVFFDSRDATLAYEPMAAIQSGLGGYQPFMDDVQDGVLHFLGDRYEKRDDAEGTWIYSLTVGYNAIHVLRQERL